MGSENRRAPRRRILHLVAATLASCLWAAPAGSTSHRSLDIVIEPWAPFADEDLPGRGFLSRITEAAFEEVGFHPHVSFVPWARALWEVQNGERDVLMGLYYSDRRADIYWYSNPIYRTQVGLVARAGFERESYESLDDLAEYKIGIVRGAIHSEAFDAAVEAEHLDVDMASDHSRHIRMLFGGRIDLIAGSFDTIVHAAAPRTASDMMFLDPPLKTHEIHIGVSRALAGGEYIRNEFNRGLRIIRENGTYQKILENYHFAE